MKLASVITFSTPKKMKFDVRVVYTIEFENPFEFRINDSRDAIKMYKFKTKTNT
jgi:hypothetical protein